MLFTTSTYSNQNEKEYGADKSIDEMLMVINLIRLMSEFRDSDNNDLENYIECSIDSRLWSSHSPLRDANKNDKYSVVGIERMKKVHVYLLTVLEEYRSTNNGAKCVK